MTGRRGRELVGTSIVERYPTIVGSELWHAYAQVLLTGRPREVGPVRLRRRRPRGIDAEAVYTVRASRFGGGLLVDLGPARRAAPVRRPARARPSGSASSAGASGTWSPTASTGPTGCTRSSSGTRPTARPTLEEAGALHPPGGRAAGRAAVLESFLATGPAGRPHLPDRGARRGQARAVPVRGQPRPGRPGAAGCTASCSRRDRPARPRRATAPGSPTSRPSSPSGGAASRSSTAWSPRSSRSSCRCRPACWTCPGCGVAVRYQPAEEVSRVGGDWYDVVALPDGRTPARGRRRRRPRHHRGRDDGPAAALDRRARGHQHRSRRAARLPQPDRSATTPAEPTATVVVARFDPATGTRDLGPGRPPAADPGRRRRRRPRSPARPG